jgi:hypothetical protein
MADLNTAQWANFTANVETLCGEFFPLQPTRCCVGKNRRLLISGSKVRVLVRPPIKSITCGITGRPTKREAIS